jgi:cytochrome c oxidase subunit IV
MTEHIESKRTYFWIFTALIVLTGVTTAVAYVDLGPFSVVVAITIAVGKMLLVALFFMHMRHGTGLMKLAASAALLWLVILLLLSMADFYTRGWLPVAGK